MTKAAKAIAQAASPLGKNRAARTCAEVIQQRQAKHLTAGMMTTE